jgi:hypothetical protein
MKAVKLIIAITVAAILSGCIVLPGGYGGGYRGGHHHGGHHRY